MGAHPLGETIEAVLFLPGNLSVRRPEVVAKYQRRDREGPGSAIEGFRQKIPLDSKLADLGVKLGDHASQALLSLATLLVEHLGWVALSLGICSTTSAP